MRAPIVMGLCGGRWGDGGVGKTTVANVLAKQGGFYPASPVDPVKDIAKEFFGWDGRMDDAARLLLDHICRVGRRISEGYWLDLAIAKVPKDGSVGRLVLDDVWFPNEAVWVAGCCGILFRVTRPGHDTPTLPCETVEIPNHGTLAELQRVAVLVVEKAMVDRGIA